MESETYSLHFFHSGLRLVGHKVSLDYSRAILYLLQEPLPEIKV